MDKSGKWHIDLSVNAESLGRLMLRYSDVEAFLHISVKIPPSDDNHRKLLAAAKIEITIINLVGSEIVFIEEKCFYMQELAGLTATFNSTANALGTLCIDTINMESLIGTVLQDWHAAIRNMIEVMASDILKQG